MPDPIEVVVEHGSDAHDVEHVVAGFDLKVSVSEVPITVVKADQPLALGVIYEVM